MHKRYLLLLALILLLALLPRLWLWNDQGRAGMVYPGDQDEYYRGSIHLVLQGDYYDEGQWLRPPMTSLFLAGIFAITGINIPLAMLVQCVLSAATCVVLAEIARSVFASQRAGIAAALLAAVFLPFASYASQMYAETLYIFFIAVALLLFELSRRRGMPWRWLLAGGIVWGLATLTRPVGLYALPMMMAWVWLLGRAGQRYKSALALLIGFVLVITPWAIRNYTVYDQVVLVDTNGGVSFWLGNLLEPNERELQGVWNHTIPNSATRQKVAMSRAIDNIKREPLTFLARLRYKTVSLWQLDTRLFVSNAPIGITLDERSLSFALASDVQYVAIMVLALLGLVLSLPPERNAVLLGWVVYGTLLSAVSLGHPRLRLPLLVTMIVYAALPLAHPQVIWERVKTASWFRRALLVVGVGIVGFLFYAHAYIPFVQSHYWVAMSYLGGGEQAIERAIAAAPDTYLPYVRLGDWHRQQGDRDDALVAYNAAARFAPQNTYVQAQRVDLYRHMGNEEGMQQAMDAIAAFGWDNNQMYVWAWHNLPAHTGTHLDIGAPGLGVIRGFYAAEVEEDSGRVYRWTKGHAQVRFGTQQAQNGGNTVADGKQPTHIGLVLKAHLPDTPVGVYYQHVLVETVHVGTTWQQVSIPIDARAMLTTQDDTVTLLELRSPTHIVHVDEPYPQGVVLAEAWVE